ncbi:hypothetical protein [Bradyrhizobium genosp. P]|uniref:hypothetical protein n=1 Tax=Bradyrhizobium genosp. P TaxID=83641 RepID=UPI003CE6B803
MRKLVIAAALVFLPSVGHALEDCNKYHNDLARRLDCLQQSNKELSDQVAQLSQHAMRSDRQYTLEQSKSCLRGNTGGNSFLGACGDSSSWWKLIEIK